MRRTAMANLILDTGNTENLGTTLASTSTNIALNVNNPQGMAFAAISGGGTALSALAAGPSTLGAIYATSQVGDAVSAVANARGTGLKAWSRRGTAVVA